MHKETGCVNAPLNLERLKKFFTYLCNGVNFINVLCAHFLYKILAPEIIKPNVTREKLLKLLSYKKHAHKMLMKLTPGQLSFFEECPTIKS